MTDYNLRIKLLRTLSAFIPLLEERELVIVDDKGIGQTSANSSLKVYDPDKTDIKQLYKTMRKPAKFAIEQPQNIQEGTTYFDKIDCALKRYNGTDWEIIGHTIDLDNNLGGAWTRRINIPILTPPSEDIQYKIEINGDNILVYSNDGTTVLTSGNGGLDFWSNVQSDGKDIRIYDENYGQNYFWIEIFDYVNKNAIIWVKLNAGQKEVNIVYGNDDCLVSDYHNGDMTFEFFDDFTQNTIGTKWQVQTDNTDVIDTSDSYTYIDATNGYVVMDSIGGRAFVTKYFTIDRPFIAETKVKCESYGGYGGGLLWFIKGIYFNNRCEHAYATDSNLMLRHGIDSSFTNYTGTAFSSATNVWYIRQLCLSNTDVISRTFYENGQLIGGYTLANNTDNVGARNIGFSHFVYGDSGYKAYYDWVRVRKYSPSNLSFGTPTVKEL